MKNALMAVGATAALLVAGCDEADPNRLVKRTGYETPQRWETSDPF